MVPLSRPHVARLLLLIALLGSGFLLADVLTPGSHSCGFTGGCEEVLHSRYGQLLGVPLPLLGLLSFGALFGFSLLPGRCAGRLLRALALLAGLGGLALLGVQLLVLRRVCPVCVLVDTSALALPLLTLGRRGDASPPPAGPARRAWLAAGLLAPALGAGLGAAGARGGRAPPPQVVALWAPDRVTVVEVADFQCPQCRRMHAVLARFLREEGEGVHFVRLTVPMPGHPQARHASRAYLCARRQGKGPEMAEALFAADSLDPGAYERLAASLGLSPGAYRACVADPALDRRLDDDLAWVKAASPRGLPVVWVQDQMLFGVQPVEALRSALERARRRLGSRAP